MGSFLVKKYGITLIFFTLLLLLISTINCESVPQYPEPSLSAIEVQVAKIIDGDTIYVWLENSIVSVRYIGIDTPEVMHTFVGWMSSGYLGREAAEKNQELVEGKTVKLEKDISIVDRYGRYLFYVWVDDIFVNAELVRLGLARVSTYPPDTKYVELFEELEGTARGKKRGIWEYPWR